MLNLFPATLSHTTAEVWAGRWKGPEQAEELAGRYPGLVTWRDRDDASRMYVWHPTQVLGAAPEGMSPVTVTFEESPMLFERLVRDSVQRRLLAIGFTEKGGGYVNYGRGSLLAEVPALCTSSAEPIGIYPKIIAEPLFTRNASNELILGLVVDVLYTTRLDLTAARTGAGVVLSGGGRGGQNAPRSGVPAQ